MKGASGPWRRAFLRALGEWDREALWNLAEPQSWEVLVGMLAPSRYVCAIFHEPRPRGLPAVEWQGAPAARVSAGCHRDERWGPANTRARASSQSSKRFRTKYIFPFLVNYTYMWRKYHFLFWLSARRPRHLHFLSAPSVVPLWPIIHRAYLNCIHNLYT